MEEYKGNSFKEKKENKEEEKRLQQVITSPVKTHKKSKFETFTGNFISDDASRVKDYIFKDILVPAAKKAISDVVTNGIDIILYGSSDRGGRNVPAQRYSYGSYFDRNQRNSIYDRPTSRYSRPQYNYDEIILNSRGEAEVVLTELDNAIRKYGQATVADLYDLVGMTGNYTDNNYGWTDLRDAEPIKCRDGYLLKLPKPIPID